MDVEVEIRNVRADTGWGWETKERKVGKHKRKLNGEEYVSPRIILSSEYNDLIGKKFRLYVAEGIIKEEKWSGKSEIEGTMLILFFPGKVLKEERVEDEFDDFDDEEEWEVIKEDETYARHE